jgi:hypothetical protein
VAALAVATVLAPLAGGAAPAGAASGKIPVIKARVSGNAIRLSDDSVRAGRLMFKVVAVGGSHTLQIARLHPGYELDQAGADIEKAFGGDVDAIKRVDEGISFRGGAPARPKEPGWFSVTLKAGRYVLFDQDGNAVNFLDVHGTVAPRRHVHSDGRVTTFTYGFGNRPTRLPASGWLTMRNQSDQPHFVSMLRVKPGTTARDVRRYIASGAQDNPSWALKANTDSGVISPGSKEVLKVDLPAGRYVLACFWPDSKTGMPHFMMGMWKLVTLR